MPATPPSIANLTVPGGVILYFTPTGGVERDLGHFDASKLEVEPRTEELKYYSSRSGKRRLAKSFAIEEQLTFRFPLNEPVVDNLKAFFKGDDEAWISGGERFNIGMADFQQGAARLECRPADGNGVSFDIQIPLCQLKPNGAMALDDKNVLELPMVLEVLDNYATTPTYPYGRVVVYDDDAGSA